MTFWRDEKITAQEAYRAALTAHDDFAPKNKSLRNNVLARNILHEELGYFKDSRNISYDLDDEIRDRLIAHARQDIALAVINSDVIMKEIGRIRRDQRITFILLAVLIVTVIWVAR